MPHFVPERERRSLLGWLAPDDQRAFYATNALSRLIASEAPEAGQVAELMGEVAQLQAQIQDKLDQVRAILTSAASTDRWADTKE